MPHIVIEYSDGVERNVDINTLVEAAHNGAMISGLFPEYDIKTRAVNYQYHQTGQTKDSFVHASVHLLSGRTEEQKSALATSVLKHIEPLLEKVVSVGVEIVDIDRPSYTKRVLVATN